jgi:hypothetical protein
MIVKIFTGGLLSGVFAHQPSGGQCGGIGRSDDAVTSEACRRAAKYAQKYCNFQPQGVAQTLEIGTEVLKSPEWAKPAGVAAAAARPPPAST